VTTSDILEETYIALSTNKARSGLTMLGIVIGISSVIALVAIGQGTRGSIESSIQSIGSNLIMVTPGAQRSAGSPVSAGRGSARTLKMEDAEAIAQSLSLAQAVAPELSGRYQVTSKGQNTNTSVDGVTPAYSVVKNVETDLGVFISDQNITSMSRVAVIGPTVRDDLFGEDADPVGQSIRINKLEFKIIGVTQAKGGTGFGSQDDMIFIPLTTAQRLLVGAKYVSTINVQAVNAQSMEVLQQDVTDLLLQRHNISDATLADFSVMNQADLVETASSIATTLTMLLAAIAGISLLVGGIGIMNMMLTTVTERTKEIGLRKAVGAKSKDINLQFLAEAVTLTFVGGLAGIVLGWLIAIILSSLGIIQAQVSLISVLLAFGVSAIIGIVFGYYPASRAAKLNPIAALRYE
jgi:putative ABC transport system permease protein